MVNQAVPAASDPAVAAIAIGGPRASAIEKVISRDPALNDKVTALFESEHVENVEAVIENAAQATVEEQQMGFIQAVRAYPTAVAFSMLFSTAIVMEGFDLTMINSFYGLPAFQKRFGQELADGSYAITPAWQTGLSNAVQCGQILGLMVNGWACDRFGYKKTIATSLVLIIAFIFITFFAKSLAVLTVGEILCGLPWGVFQTLTTAYGAELCPTPLRPFLTTYVNLCWVMGQFISSGVLKGVSTMPVDSQWAYRIPFALQWIWPIPILCGVYFAPESPWWLVRVGRLDDAAHSLRQLGSENPGAINAEERIAQLMHTNEAEKAMNEGTSYFDCFRGTNLRRTEIAAVAWMIQTACGSGLIGQSTVFYEQAGLSVSDAFSFNLGMYALGMVGTISSWWTMHYFGRRQLYLWGLIAMLVVLIGVGSTGFSDSTNSAWAAGSLLVVYSFFYQFTVGPVCYCVVAEIPATRLRAKTVVLARNAYNIIGIINNVLVPRMLSPLAWHWGRKTGFFFVGANVLCIAWTYFRLPEPKGRTYGELNALFEQRVSARKFSTTAVDLFGKGQEFGLEKGESAIGGHGGGIH